MVLDNDHHNQSSPSHENSSCSQSIQSRKKLTSAEKEKLSIIKRKLLEKRQLQQQIK